MKDTIKDFAPIFLKEINQASKILLHCHPSSDPDSVGSVLAMKLALETLNKNVTVIQGDDPIPEAFDFPSVKTIIPKSYFDIDISQFDLFIALDSSSKGMISNKAEIIFPETLKVIVIDHHKSNKRYGNINFVNSDYPATAQILFDLFKEIKINFNHDIALNLFMGIYTDTGGFKYLKDPVPTLEIVGELAKFAPDYPNTIFTLENSNKKQKLIFEGLALLSIKEFFNGIVAVASVSRDDLVKNNINKEDIIPSIISNQLKSVIGYDIGIVMVEEDKDMVKLSIRTRDSNKYDVSKLAVSLGGGGHMAAAGARLNMNIQNAIDKVVENIKVIYNL